MNKGFVLFNTLIICSIVTMLSLNILSISNNYLICLQREKALREMCEIEEKVISRIKSEYSCFKEENFTSYKNGTYILVTYDGLLATITLTGRYNYICYLQYDDISNTVSGYWYDD